MKKRIMAVLLAVCIMVSSAPYLAADVQAEEIQTDTYVGLDAEYHTQDEIREYYKNHPIKDMEAEFVTEPSVTEPYALGELTDETKQDALNMLNLYRYITGVPEVSITDTAQEYAQAAALVCAINQRMSHIPTSHPAGMDDDMYSKAVYGSYNSNLASGRSRLCSSIYSMMLEINGDSDFGHRRQLLEYYYTEAGFGMARSQNGSRFSSVFVDANFKEDKVISYPGANQPLEYFGSGYAWTVIVPEEVDPSSINVNLTDMNTGKVWNYRQDSDDFRLDIEGGSTCVIFAPNNVDYKDGDSFKVEITGIQKPISYEVHMFLLGDSVPLESIAFSGVSFIPTEGKVNGGYSVDYFPENATNKSIIWSSSDPDIGEPVWNGTGSCMINAKKPGTFILTATSEDGGYTASVEVTVLEKAKVVILDKTDVTIGVGQTFQLMGKTQTPEASVFYSGYDRDVISVKEGHIHGQIAITGKSVGETTITAYAYSNQDINASCKIHVVEPVYTESIQLNLTEIDLMKGDTIHLDTLVSPSNITCKEIKWSSKDGNIAKVSDGLVTAIGNSVGQTVITAEALDGSGKKAQCIVSVYSKFGKMRAPDVSSYTSNRVVLREMENSEYSKDLKNWQDSNIFENLEPNHKYTFYIRQKAYGYLKTGDASEGTVVITKALMPSNCSHTDLEVRDEIKASCLNCGYTGDTYCKKCEVRMFSGKTIDALGHDYVSVVTKNPTIKEEGIRTYTCNRCQDSYTEPIKKLSNKDEDHEEQNPQSPPATAENISKATVTLSKNVCNYNGTAQKPTVKIVKLGQRILNSDIDYTVKYVNNVKIGTAAVIITGTGSYTGSVMKYFSIVAKKGSFYNVNTYKYQITSSSSVSVKGITNNKVTKVKIPKTVKIGGKTFKVTAIGSSAFKNNKKITSVEIGNNVKTIGVSAFEGCAKLGKATLGKGITELGGNAFKNCKKLGTITIKSMKLKKVGKNALKGIKATAKIKVPAKKLSVYKKLFKNKGQGRRVKIVK